MGKPDAKAMAMLLGFSGRARQMRLAAKIERALKRQMKSSLGQMKRVDDATSTPENQGQSGLCPRSSNLVLCGRIWERRTEDQVPLLLQKS
eukprot:1148781-Pelagomonas_calceolata.AAC.1